MIAPTLLPLIRRAILDLLADVGGELNDDVVAVLLSGLGHRVARRDVRDVLAWLAAEQLVVTEEVGVYLVASVRPDGIDVAAGNLKVDGISRHKTGGR